MIQNIAKKIFSASKWFAKISNNNRMRHELNIKMFLANFCLLKSKKGIASTRQWQPHKRKYFFSYNLKAIKKKLASGVSILRWKGRSAAQPKILNSQSLRGKVIWTFSGSLLHSFDKDVTTSWSVLLISRRPHVVGNLFRLIDPIWSSSSALHGCIHPRADVQIVIIIWSLTVSLA